MSDFPTLSTLLKTHKLWGDTDYVFAQDPDNLYGFNFISELLKAHKIQLKSDIPDFYSAPKITKPVVTEFLQLRDFNWPFGTDPHWVEWVTERGDLEGVLFFGVKNHTQQDGEEGVSLQCLILSVEMDDKEFAYGAYSVVFSTEPLPLDTSRDVSTWGKPGEAIPSMIPRSLRQSPKFDMASHRLFAAGAVQQVLQKGIIPFLKYEAKKVPAHKGKHKNAKREFGIEAVDSYYILDIKNQVKRARSDPLHISNIRQRYHLRRGHWRQYQSGKRVWIDAYHAGNKALGRVEKDYMV